MCNFNTVTALPQGLSVDGHATDRYVPDEMLCAQAQVIQIYEDPRSRAGSANKALLRVYIQPNDWPAEHRDRIFGIGNGADSGIAGYVVDGHGLVVGDEVALYWCIYVRDTQVTTQGHVLLLRRHDHAKKNTQARAAAKVSVPADQLRQRRTRVYRACESLALRRGYAKMTKGARLAWLLDNLFGDRTTAVRALQISLRSATAHTNGKFSPTCTTVQALCDWAQTELPRKRILGDNGKTNQKREQG